jgi:thiamine kinase-like enzyme
MDESRQTVMQMKYWRTPVDPLPLKGGITNKSYLVEHGGERLVVRIGEDIAVHGISRAIELASARAAFAAGISPEIVHAEPGAVVMRYVEGRTLEPADVRGDEVLKRILPTLLRCHRDIPKHFRGPAPMFWVFQVLRDYAGTLAERSSRSLGEVPRLMRAAAQLERAVGAIDVVFGHNDLLAANFIDDGDKIWLIDWDYAGFNSPLFDLGGLASNNELSASQQEWLLESYFDRTVSDDLRRRYAAMKCASLLRETMWSMVSEITSTLDFDYAAYTAENLARFERAWSDFRTDFD